MAVRVIQREVADAFKISVSKMLSRSSERDVVQPRQVAQYLCTQLTDLSLTKLSIYFRRQHHTTTMYSVEAVQRRRRDDQRFDETVAGLERCLREKLAQAMAVNLSAEDEADEWWETLDAAPKIALRSLVRQVSA